MTSTPHQNLLSVIADPGKQRWAVLHLQQSNTNNPTNNHAAPIRDATSFDTRLKQGLRPTFKTRISTLTHDFALWAVVDLLSVGNKGETLSTYLVHHPHGQFVFASTMFSMRVQQQFFHSLQFVFQCDNVRRINCVGNDLGSITDMALFPLSQGSFGAYRLYRAVLDDAPLEVGNHDEDGERKRHRIRVEDRAEQMEAIETELGGGAGLRHTGMVIDERVTQDMLQKTTGALTTSQQRDALPKGTKSMTEIAIVVEKDIEWDNKKAPFKCAVTVCGKEIVARVKDLTKYGMVSKTGLPDVMGDASHIIQNAFLAPARVITTATTTDDADMDEEERQFQAVTTTTTTTKYGSEEDQIRAVRVALGGVKRPWNQKGRN